ncbi:hypothetical protein [Timonella senegalensis]|uniref:hypothetical protein n=1 Tax=Timonella senegalensis TaxID=1465825 RepID=UPI002FE221C5
MRTKDEATELSRGEISDERIAAPSFDLLVDWVNWRFGEQANPIVDKLVRGEIVDELGRPWQVTSPYRAGALIFFYRDPEPEVRVPFEVEVIFEDDDLLVVDKPHFLASTPKGAYVVESALVRVRRAMNMPELSPAHRLDRVTNFATPTMICLPSARSSRRTRQWRRSARIWNCPRWCAHGSKRSRAS